MTASSTSFALEIKNESAAPLRFSDYIQGNKLNLSKQGLTDADIADVLAVLNKNPHIKNVNLSDNEIKAQGAKEFAQGNKSAIQVNLNDNQIRDQGAKDFSENNKVATAVDLRDNGITDQGVKDFVAENKIAITVNFSNNEINNKGIKAFVEGNKIATTVFFNQCLIGDQGANYFAEGNELVTSVGLSENAIGDPGAKALAEKNKMAAIVDLSSNYITDLGARALMKSKVIQELDVGANMISIPLLEQLQKEIALNKGYARAWLETSISLAGVRATFAHPFASSILPVVPLIMKFAGLPKPLSDFEEKETKSSPGMMRFFNQHLGRLSAPTPPSQPKVTNQAKIRSKL